MRRRNNRYHPYYVGRRSARISFLAGVGTFLMLLAAAGCVGFAVYMMLDLRPEQIRAVVATHNTYETPQYAETALVVTEPSVEPTSWIQLLPPSAYIPEEEIYDTLPPDTQETVNILPTPAPTPNVPAPPIPWEYTALPFYMHDNSDLYAEFWRQRPDLDVETVIWKVNASVHIPFYSQIRINHQPNPLFVSPTYRLPYGFLPAELVSVNHDECHLLATPETVAAFRRLREASQNAGFDISVTSAYRTATRQSELWVNGGRRDGRVARPHHSEHQTGRALDLWGPGGLLDAGGPSPTGRWVAANAHNYGFIIRYRAETTHITGYIHEPWHITFVGETISQYMHDNNILSLEEFVGRNPGAALPHFQ
ncbi:MAG: M15 family metallopeptidase [Defluviitaleaceae bacterium]|nr:M15 family metallopeptidase [Defluviitaleaceae bacterium]